MGTREEELRRRAVERRKRGERTATVARALGRSVQWAWKWWARAQWGGEIALRSLSRAPHIVANKLPKGVREKVVAARRALEKGGTRHTQYAGYGAEAVRWELESQGLQPSPS